MSERDQDHWESLLGQLGAVPQQPPPRPAKKPTSEEPRKTAPPPRVRPPSTDWTDVAKDLGVSPADVLPAEALRRRVTEDFVRPLRSDEPSFTAAPVARGEKTEPTLREEPASRRELPEERPAPPKPPAALGGFGAGILLDLSPAEEPAENAPPAWLEEVEAETQPQEKAKRRRRRRGRARDQARGDEAPAEAAPSDREQGEVTEQSEEFPPDAVAEEEQERPRRRRRRGSRRDDDRRRDSRRPRREESPEPVPVADESSPDSVVAEENHEPLDDEETRDEAEHRNIPSWEEAIGVIVAKNMEGRQKNPNGYRSRGRSRGRG